MVAVISSRPHARHLTHCHDPSVGSTYPAAAVWNSKEDSDRFVSDPLLANAPVDGGLVGPPEERGAEIANLETV